ncbi:MAG: T9SS type A sorting domain-containing protein [Chitinophagaceae bacterium]
MKKNIIALSIFLNAVLFCTFQQANASTFTVSNTNDAGAGSLRQAILDANANPGSDIIDATGITGTINILSVLPNITESVTISGPGMSLLTLNQTIDRRIFTTGSGAIIFLLQDVTLNFSGPGITPYSGGGGAILAGGAGASTTLINITFSNFLFQIGNGGVISQSSALNNHNLVVTNCFFNNNKCGGAGGAISFNSLGGTATIAGCTFSGNVTGPVGANLGGDGGAVATTGGSSGGTYTVEKNTFLNNQVLNTFGHAGALINTNGASTIRFNRLIGNTCANIANPPLANIIGQAGGSTVNTTIADNNWWGVNSGPGPNDAASFGAGGTMTVSKWLQLKTTASPNTICNTTPSGPGNTSAVSAGFLSNSANEAIVLSNISVLIGLPVTWSNTLGNLSLQQTTIQASGNATALFTSNGTGGIATVNAQVDNVPVSETTPARANITVNTVSVAPTGISGSTAICSGNNTILTVTGGSKGTGANTEWFTGSCGGTPAGTGDALSVSPITATTYYVRYNGFCNATLCVSVTVTVAQPVNAGTDGNTLICDNSTSVIDLYGLITGEQSGGTWTRLTGSGGTFNAGAGSFTPAAGATTSTFKYLLTGTSPCPDDESIATVNITAQVNAGADGSTSICDNSSSVIDLYSLITGEQSGGVWTRLTGSGGTFNAGAGSFTPAAGATTSTFKYLLTGTSPCPNDESIATVNISAQANAGADGSMDVCEDANIVVDLYNLITGEQSGGVWTRLTGSGGTFNAGAGTFTTTAGATTNSTFKYLVAGISPCPDDESIATVNIITCCTPVNFGTVANGNETICYGGNPSNIIFSVAPSGGAVGGSFAYQWYYKNGVSDPCPTGTNTSGWTLISGATGNSYDPPSGLTTSRTYAVTVDPIGTPDCGVATWASGCRKITVSPALVATCSNNNPSIYFGAPGNQTSAINATVSGGVAPYTVSITMNRPLYCNVITSSGDEIWTDNGGSSINNVCPASGPGLLPPVSTGVVAASGGFYSVNVTLMQDAIFTATITDALGCVTTCTTSIHAEDARCFSGNSGNAKVKLCHQTSSNNNPCVSICVNESAVSAHLAHGDFLGDCTPDCIPPVYSKGVGIEKEPEISVQFNIRIVPNPSDNHFTLLVEGSDYEKISVMVYDVLGRVVKQFEKTDGRLLQFGEELMRGNYLAVVRQGNKIRTIKLIKQ